MEQRNRRSITYNLVEWVIFQPTMTQNSTGFLTYTYVLVATLPLAKYSHATMIIIDHIYIGILPGSDHATIQRYVSTFVTQQQRAHEQ